MIITNGSSRPLSKTSTSMPNVTEALDNWLQTIDISRITKSIVDFQVVETYTEKTVYAVLQPFTTKQLQIRPEGERGWSWYTLHVKDPDEFFLDDVIYIGEKRYRIMQKFEWSDYGYFNYEMIEDFTTPNDRQYHLMSEDASFLLQEDGSRINL